MYEKIYLTDFSDLEYDSFIINEGVLHMCKAPFLMVFSGRRVEMGEEECGYVWEYRFIRPHGYGK